MVYSLYLPQYQSGYHSGEAVKIGSHGRHQEVMPTYMETDYKLFHDSLASNTKSVVTYTMTIHDIT